MNSIVRAKGRSERERLMLQAVREMENSETREEYQEYLREYRELREMVKESYPIGLGYQVEPYLWDKVIS
jgi:hypothetical protein